ncbi:MAG: RNA-directed DNA polymerase, partial [Isosphaeraceae bacterium]
MSTNDEEKAKLHRRIVESANPFAVLERMRTLGFWPKGTPVPPDPPEEVAERARVEAELAELRRRRAASADPEKALEQERKRRWEASKQRRAEARA